MKTILVIENGGEIARKLWACNLNAKLERYNDCDKALKRLIKNHFDIVIIDSGFRCNHPDINISKLVRTAAITGKPILILSTFNILSSLMVLKDYFKNLINENIRYSFFPSLSSLKLSVSEMLEIIPISNSIMFHRLLKG